MSGGSFDYLYRRVEDMADELDGGTPLDKAFAAHLRLVSRAMHDVEWVYSGDYGPGGADESMRAVVSPEVEAVRVDTHPLQTKIKSDQFILDLDPP